MTDKTNGHGMATSGNGRAEQAAADIDTLEMEFQQLTVAERKARDLWKKLSGELEACSSERAEIASKKMVVSQQLQAIYKKQSGGKYVNRG